MHRMEFHAIAEKNEVSAFVGQWLELQIIVKIFIFELGVLAHDFNPSTEEDETGISSNLRPV